MTVWLVSYTAGIGVKVEIDTGEMLFEDVAVPRLALKEAIKKEPKCMAWMGCKARLCNEHLGLISNFTMHHFNSYWSIMCLSPRAHLLTITQLA